MNDYLDCPSIHSRRLLRISHLFSGVLQINESCIANEYVSLMGRHLISREHLINDRVINAAHEAFQLLREEYPATPLTKYSFEQVINAKPPSLRKKARNAYQNILNGGMHEKLYQINMFVKNERMSIRDPLKPPRAIQARSPEYTILLQRYIMPYSKQWRTYEPHGPILVGCDQLEIAFILHTAWISYDDPVAVLLDHKNFDSGVHTIWLKEEHRYVCEHFPNDPEPRVLLERQLMNKCRTQNKLRYSMIGTRCSGDANTSSGNSTINFAMLKRLFRDVTKHIYNIGDDSVVILSRQSYNLLFNLGRFNELGVDYLWETPYTMVDEFEQIDFCQCKPVKTINGWIMVRHPERVLTRSSFCIDQSIKDVPTLLRWLRGVGLCEYAVNPGVPILQCYAEWCMSHTNKDPIYEPNYKQWMRRLNVHDHSITLEARLTFEKAFGITIDQQLFIESSIKQMIIDPVIIYNISLHAQALHSVIHHE